jgi:hypothetical protein
MATHVPTWVLDPECESHSYNMPDGHCTCTYTCSDCETTYVGYSHTKEDCIKSLRKQLDEAKRV